MVLRRGPGRADPVATDGVSSGCGRHRCRAVCLVRPAVRGASPRDGPRGLDRAQWGLARSTRGNRCRVSALRDADERRSRGVCEAMALRTRAVGRTVRGSRSGSHTIRRDGDDGGAQGCPVDCRSNRWPLATGGADQGPGHSASEPLYSRGISARSNHCLRYSERSGCRPVVRGRPAIPVFGCSSDSLGHRGHRDGWAGTVAIAVAPIAVVMCLRSAGCRIGFPRRPPERRRSNLGHRTVSSAGRVPVIGSPRGHGPVQPDRSSQEVGRGYRLFVAHSLTCGAVSASETMTP